MLSPSDMVGKGGSINQETSVKLSVPVEESDKEGDFSDYDNTLQAKSNRNKLYVLYKLFHINDYQELNISSIEKGKSTHSKYVL